MSKSVVGTNESLLHEVQTLVNQRFPGIQLESPVQGWAYLGEFDQGISTYSALINPTGGDDRWLGVCYFQIFEDMRAQEAFFRALAKGEEAARVNLAHLLRFLERSEEAVAELLRVDVKKLNQYDLVLYLRVSSLHEETNGNIRKAVDFAETAWEKVQGIPEYQILAPSVLGQLGILYGRMGEARRALWYFEKGVALTTGLEQQKVKLRRATLLLNLGRCSEVARELQLLGELPEALDLERELLHGEILWSTGQFEEAILRFLDIVATASRLAAGSDEFSARLALAAIYSHQGEFFEAHDHLDKARILISDRTDVLMHRFRQILLNLRSGHYVSSEAASELEMLAIEFGSIGTLQEEASVRLHLANVYHTFSDSLFAEQMVAVRKICQKVHNSMFLQKEWRLMPELREAVTGLGSALLKNSRGQLTIFSVGQEALFFDGGPVHLPMKKSVEILAYFLDVQEASLKDLVTEFFPDKKSRSARSYFHQFRNYLRSKLPGIELTYDRSRDIYVLQSAHDIVWDLPSVQDGESRALSGRFLPSSRSNWARNVNRRLDGFLYRE